MSIIHEALKKTQKQKESIPARETAKQEAGCFDGKKKKILFWKNKKYPAVILLVLAFLPLYFFLKPGAAPEKPAPAGNNVFSKYILEGIVYDKDAPFAVINGKAVKKLERVDEFIVSDISESEVELTEPVEGGKIILSLAF